MSISESLAGDIPEYVGPTVGPSVEPPALGIIEQLTNALTGLFSVQDAQHTVAGRTSGVILRGTLLVYLDRERLPEPLVVLLRPRGRLLRP